MSTDKKITFMLAVHNEEKRIRYVLENALVWADEIIIFNKESSDNTIEICKTYSNVVIVNLPFSLAGSDSATENLKYATNEWVFISTASEMPTKKLIDSIKIVINNCDDIELIYVPRRMYSFGINSDKSPWNIAYYPFMVNKNKAIIRDTIHNNFSPRNKDKTYTINYSEDCCVYHLTHETADLYMTRMSEYFVSEANNCTDPDKKIIECFRNISQYEKFLRENPGDLLGLYCAWSIYWLGTALFVWEKFRGIDVKSYYNSKREKLLKSELDVNSELINKEAVPDPKWIFTGSVILGIDINDPRNVFLFFKIFIKLLVKGVKNRVKKYSNKIKNAF